MNKILKLFGVLSLLATILVACNKEIVPTDNDGDDNSITKTIGSTDYYWYQGKKIFLKQVENKSFIIYHISDKQSLISSLKKRGVDLDSSNMYPYTVGPMNLNEGDSKIFSDCEWAEVSINHKTALLIPEVIYASPYYSDNGWEFPLTNLVYVHFNGYSELFLLEKFAKECNAIILGQSPIPSNVFIMYIVLCTKDSKGNAMDVSNWLYDKKCFRAVEPGFIAARGASGS